MNQEILEKINRVPIFDIMNVRGYCVCIDGVIRTFVFAADIAREAGLLRTKTYYDREKPMCPTSGAQPEYYIHDIIRWDKFNQYVNLSLESFTRINPPILPLIQLPIHRYSYISCELALVVLMHCKSKKAVDFQVKLATIIMPKIQQDTINFYENKINDMQSLIDTNSENINYNIALLKDIAEFGSMYELKDIIMSMPYVERRNQ